MSLYSIGPLQIMQIMCMTVFLTLSFVLFTSRFTIPKQKPVYERSRRGLAIANAILALHYGLQFFFNIRGTYGDDVGTLVNVVFYATCNYFTASSLVYLKSGGVMPKRPFIVYNVSLALIYTVIIIGRLVYGSWHMPHAIYTVSFVFLLTSLYNFYSNWEGLKIMRVVLQNEMGNDPVNIIHFMHAGNRLLLIAIAASPFICFTRIGMGVFGPFIICIIVYFIVCFVSMGHTVTPVLEAIEGVQDEYRKRGLSPRQLLEDIRRTGDYLHAPLHHDVQTKEEAQLDEEEYSKIEVSLEHWLGERGFSDANITLVGLAGKLGVTRSTLSTYFTQHKQCNFRVWLSGIRLDEAKRLITKYPDYGNEYIAQECGYTSRSYFQRVFKEATGCTPLEWRDAHGKS